MLGCSDNFYFNRISGSYMCPLDASSWNEMSSLSLNYTQRTHCVLEQL